MEDLLEKYRKNEHLQAPEGYFESLPDEVMAQIRLGELREKSIAAEEKLVPAGYFESLPDEVAAQIRLGELREKSLQAEEKLVPAGYFESLPDEVAAQIRLGELREKSIAAEEKLVPAGYFESLPDEVAAQIRLGELREKSLQAEEKLVPAGYFESLPDEVVAQIRLGELREKSIAAEEKLVPAGYFESLPDEVVAKIGNDQVSRIAFRQRWHKIASIAACGLVVLGVGLFAGLHFTQNDTSARLAHQNPVKIIKKIVVKSRPQPEAPLLAAAEIPADTKKASPARRHQASQPAVDNDLVPIGDFETEDLNSIDYDLLEMYSDDYTLADYWEL